MPETSTATGGRPGPVVFTRGEAADLGIGRGALGGPRYPRVRRGLYAVPEALDGHPDHRILLAAAGLPQGVVLGGWAAARLHVLAARRRTAGAPGRLAPVAFTGRAADGGPAPVLLCAQPSVRLRRRDGVTVFRSALTDGERRVVGGVPVTSAVRTAFDLARTAPTEPAVVGLDALRAEGVLDGARWAELTALCSARRRWCGAAAATSAVGLSSAGVTSPALTRLRLLWVASGLPVPRTAAVVHLLGSGHAVPVDLLDARGGVAAGYDHGAAWSPADRSARAAEEELLAAAGLVVVRATAADLAGPAARAAWLARLAAAYRLAAGVRAARRRWLVLPAGEAFRTAG